ncbi:MAG: hypothetical protein WC205_11525 [Opitutaceae bacterium]|jgi:hypothetical protein
MKRPALFSLLLVSGLLMTTRAPAMELVVLGSEESRAGTTPGIAVASGGTATVDLLIPASVDRANLWFDLRQVSGTMTLPLGEMQPFTGLPMEKSPSDNIARVGITVPKLERKSQIIVRFFLKTEPPVNLGLVRLVVYPPVDWTPLSRRLKKDGPNLLVFGQEEGLRTFFKSHDIAFADLGGNLPERLENEDLAVGSVTSREWNDRKDRLVSEGGRMIALVADPDALPGVYATPLGVGMVTKVTLPVLAKLSSDPRSEELLFQLIEQQLNSAPGATP